MLEDKCIHYILYGGGIDSTTVALLVLASIIGNEKKEDEIVLAHFNYGQKAYFKEDKSANLLLDNMQTILPNKVTKLSLKTDLSFSNSRLIQGNEPTNPEDDRLEMRNVVLLSVLSSYIATKDNSSALVSTGFIVSESNLIKDASLSLLDRMEAIVNLTTSTKYDISFVAPLLEMGYTHKQAYDLGVQIGEKLNIPFDKIIYSCYEGSECGKCRHCLELKQYRNEGSNE